MVNDILTHVALNGFDLNCACASVLHARSRATKTTVKQRNGFQFKSTSTAVVYSTCTTVDSQLKAHNGCTSPVSTLCTTNITYSTRGFQLEINLGPLLKFGANAYGEIPCMCAAQSLNHAKPCLHLVHI